MFSFSIFNEDEFVKFKQALEKYCSSMNYHDMNLTNNELKQLFGFMGDKQVTPEARGSEIADQFHFEIKRGLARRYSFELLLRGETPSEEAYREFIQAQGKPYLPFNAFTQLSQEARSLDEDVKALTRASCFFYMHNQLKQALNENGYTLSTDSEEFLSQFSDTISKDTKLTLLCPATAAFTDKQRKLFPKMFWPNMQFRHLLYTEGGDSMTKTFSDAVVRNDFSKQDFSAWKWRWLTNLFGFQSGPAAKYYDENLHFLASTIVGELEKILSNPTYSYLDNYLLKRAELAGFNDGKLSLSKSEQQWLGHIAAYCNQLNVLTPEMGKAIFVGYSEFKKEFEDTGKLAALYDDQRKDKAAVTPTYAPAVINGAYLVFKTKFKMNEEESLKHASQFTCQVLLGLYSLPHDKRISCMNLAKEANLQSVLEKWLSDHHSFNFKMNDNFDLVAEETVKLQKAFNY